MTLFKGFDIGVLITAINKVRKCVHIHLYVLKLSNAVDYILNFAWASFSAMSLPLDVCILLNLRGNFFTVSDRMAFDLSFKDHCSCKGMLWPRLSLFLAVLPISKSSSSF